tara:strand:- start:16876 stop:18585 length:1710 start_codon:yes stop_codon:yes gene_type:complete
MKNNNNNQSEIIEREYCMDNNLKSLDPIIARILSSRGITNLEQTKYNLSSIAPISSLCNVNSAVNVLIENMNKQIVIVGDYDVDGATAVSLLMRCLSDFGFKKLNYIVPNRLRDGYGLTEDVVLDANSLNPNLLITVDNGISSIEGVRKARELDIDVIITDHHLPGSIIPNANVIVNPNLANSNFLSPNLAGVGVAFYVMAALGKELENQGNNGASKIVLKYLDLVALGTVADVVKFDFNNRVIVDRGIKAIRKGICSSGILTLIKESGKDHKKINSQDLGFSVAPKINSAGRLDDISIGIECLLTDDLAKARKLSETLIATNKERKNIQTKMQEDANNIVSGIKKDDLSSCICIFHDDWHQGIVGLIASRLKEKCNRPVIAFASEGNGNIKGSARSINGIHIRDILESVASEKSDLIIKFGGHAMAAGLTIKKHNYEEFQFSISKIMNKIYPDFDFTGKIVTDGKIPSNKLNAGFAKQLENFGPWGKDFEEPKFHGKFHVHDQRVVGNHHLKMEVRPVEGHKIIDAIAFNQDKIIARDSVGFVYRLCLNEFRGNTKVQLIVEKIYGEI